MPMPKAHDARKNMIGLKLKALREARGLSQRELAKQFQLIGCDIDQNVITRTERGERKVNDREIWAITIVFGITSADLFEKNELDPV
ncbi:MAG: helix-turn-helix transcriptional regulator, partial [Lachnospiraceae bacterium]|nr:helix-turn-helix transcriptional regulator [Lachnospiraceae bacterium]